MNTAMFYQKEWERKAASNPVLEFAANNRINSVAKLLVDEGTVGPGTDVLDVGCGNGCLCLHFREHGANAVGIDVEPGAVRIARKHDIDARVVDVDTNGLPFGDASLDVITALDVTEHLFDVEAFLAECVRVLRPGGTLAVHTPNIMYYGWLYRLLKGNFPSTSGEEVKAHGGHINFYTWNDYRGILAHLGMTVTRHRLFIDERPMPAQLEDYLRYLNRDMGEDEFIMNFRSTRIIFTAVKEGVTA